MIALLNGKLVSEDTDSVIVMCAGVGYEVTCSANTLSAVAGEAEVELFIYTHVREDQLHLFGFTSMIEKKLFLSLLKVNGIGPKLAVTILSAAKVSDIVELIENGDAKGLSKLPRIGKKTAEQMILSLKGQLVMEEKEEGSAGTGARLGKKAEVVSALVNLGFRMPDVEEVVGGLDPEMDLQESIRKGLSLLTN